MASLIKHAGTVAVTTLVGLAAAPVLVGTVAGLIPSIALSALSIALLSAENSGHLRKGMSRILIPVVAFLTLVTTASLFYIFGVPLVASILIIGCLAVAGFILTPHAGYYLVDKPQKNSEIDTVLEPYQKQVEALGYDPKSQNPDIQSKQNKGDQLYAWMISARNYLEVQQNEGKPLLLPQSLIDSFTQIYQEPTYD